MGFHDQILLPRLTRQKGIFLLHLLLSYLLLLLNLKEHQPARCRRFMKGLNFYILRFPEIYSLKLLLDHHHYLFMSSHLEYLHILLYNTPNHHLYICLLAEPFLFFHLQIIHLSRKDLNLEAAILSMKEEKLLLIEMALEFQTKEESMLMAHALLQLSCIIQDIQE